MKVKELAVIMIFVVICYGCKKSIVPKGSTVYQEVANGSLNPAERTKIAVQPYKLDKRLKVSIKELDKAITFSSEEKIPKSGEVIPFEGNTGLYLQDGGYFFLSSVSEKHTSISYYTIKPQISGITIPIKIRPRYESPNIAVRDSFPSQVETGISIGFSFGPKFQKTTFQSTKNSFGKNTVISSITPGVFLSLGGSDITKANTRPAIVFAQKAAVLSKGFYLVYGINNLNLGAAVGWDNAYGTNKNKWIYNSKAWYGIVIALSFVK